MATIKKTNSSSLGKKSLSMAGTKYTTHSIYNDFFTLNEMPAKAKSSAKPKNTEEIVSYKSSHYNKSDCVKITKENQCFCGGYEYIPSSLCVQTENGDYILKEIAIAIITRIDKYNHGDMDVIYKNSCVEHKHYSLSHKNIWGTSLDTDLPLRTKITTIYNSGIRNVYFKDESTLIDAGYVEDFMSGTFILQEHKTALEKSGKRELADYQKFHNPIQNMDRLSKTDLVEYGIESPTFIKTEGKKYTYGIEAETIRGVVPDYVRHKYNMCAKFDGSLRLEDGNAHGAEYITGVLKGDAGLIHIYKIMNELSKRCAINKLCSIHVHVGSVDFNQEYIVYMYKLGLYIEKELFSMMPISRSKSEYCQKMKKIDLAVRDDSNHEIDIKNAFEEIRKIINVVDIKDGYKVSKKKDHPMGHCCGYKRDTPRYWWLNFVPAMYNIRGDESFTMEFRIHSATLNYKKVENWILICLGIINFVENHKRMIKPGITLRQIMTTVYPKNGTRLAEYIDKRKSIFSTGSSNTEVMEYSANENIFDEHLKTKKQILTS